MKIIEAVHILKMISDEFQKANMDSETAALQMAIRNLVQAENCCSVIPNSADTISRQAAIDAISCDITITGRQNAWIVTKTIETFVDRIKTLPSAEPERKKCKWCESLKERHLRIEYYWIDSEGCTASFQDKEGHIVATGIANFCPNCGADLSQNNREEKHDRGTD